METSYAFAVLLGVVAVAAAIIAGNVIASLGTQRDDYRARLRVAEAEATHLRRLLARRGDDDGGGDGHTGRTTSPLVPPDPPDPPGFAVPPPPPTRQQRRDAARWPGRTGRPVTWASRWVGRSGGPPAIEIRVGVFAPKVEGAILLIGHLTPKTKRWTKNPVPGVAVVLKDRDPRLYAVVMAALQRKDWLALGDALQEELGGASHCRDFVARLAELCAAGPPPAGGSGRGHK